MTFDDWLQVEPNSDALAELLVTPFEFVFMAGRAQERERCCEVIRKACGMCEGKGYVEAPDG